MGHDIHQPVGRVCENVQQGGASQSTCRSVSHSDQQQQQLGTKQWLPSCLCCVTVCRGVQSSTAESYWGASMSAAPVGWQAPSCSSPSKRMQHVHACSGAERMPGDRAARPPSAAGGCGPPAPGSAPACRPQSPLPGPPVQDRRSKDHTVSYIMRHRRAAVPALHELWVRRAGVACDGQQVAEQDAERLAPRGGGLHACL